MFDVLAEHHGLDYIYIWNDEMKKKKRIIILKKKRKMAPHNFNL